MEGLTHELPARVFGLLGDRRSVVQFDHRDELRIGLQLSPESEQRLTESESGLLVAGLKFDRAAQMTLRVFGLPVLKETGAEVAMRPRVVAGPFDGLPQNEDRFRIFLLARERHTQADQTVRVIRGKVERLRQVLHREIQSSQIAHRHAEVVKDGQTLRPLEPEQLQDPDRLLALPLFEFGHRRVERVGLTGPGDHVTRIVPAVSSITTRDRPPSRWYSVRIKSVTAERNASVFGTRASFGKSDQSKSLTEMVNVDPCDDGMVTPRTVGARTNPRRRAGRPSFR